jgi:hypothetical protein
LIYTQTGEYPQNYIRDILPEERFRDYPKLNDLIKLKDELIEQRQTVLPFTLARHVRKTRSKKPRPFLFRKIRCHHSRPSMGAISKKSPNGN